MSSGKLSGIKKIYILRGSAIACFTFALLFIFLSFYFKRKNDEWFFLFCLFCGVHELVKGRLYNSDSSSYLGSLLISIGALFLSGIFFNVPQRIGLLPFSFSMASIYTYLRFSDIIHLIFGTVYCYEGIILYLFLLEKLNLIKFLVFNIVLFFIFLLFCAIICLVIAKGRRKHV